MDNIIIKYEGKAYRVESGNMGIPSKTTVKDVIDFEADELGNEDVRVIAELVAKELGIDLASLSSENIIWVVRDKETAKELYGYGEEEPSEIDIPEGSVILTDLGGDGVLILKANEKVRNYGHS